MFRLTTFSFLLSLLTYFQVEAKRVNGTIFYEHDTIETLLTIPAKLFGLGKDPRYDLLQTGIYRYDDDGAKIEVLPSEVLEIRFKWKRDIIRMVAVNDESGILPEKEMFLKLESDGQLKLFSYYDWQQTMVYNPTTKRMEPYSMLVGSYFILKDQSIKKLEEKTIRQEAIELFQDCPKLIQKLRSKQVDADQFLRMVEFYNTRCED